MYRQFLLLISGLALCFGNVLPEQEDVNGTSVRFGIYNRYYLHNRNTYGSETLLTVGNVEANVHLFVGKDVTHTIILIHGHGQSKNSRFNQELIRALLEYDHRNDDAHIDVIVVDWEYYASQSYANSGMIVPSIAEDVGKLVQKLIETNVDGRTEKLASVKNIHIIGFDLGAHVAGIVSKNLKDRVARITGLDPAAESWSANLNRLSQGDAEYVEVIHTDAFGARPIGISDPLGRIDVYPNGGTSQPGCSNAPACNHEYAWLLFVATIDVTDRYLNANSCNSITEVTTNRCAGPTSVVGGLTTRKFGQGLYRANTVAAYPYF